MSRLKYDDMNQRVKVTADGMIVAESMDAKVMHEQGHTPVYYFPRDDVRMDLMEPTDHQTH